MKASGKKDVLAQDYTVEREVRDCANLASEEVYEVEFCRVQVRKKDNSEFQTGECSRKPHYCLSQEVVNS